jgi:hypothetical protein
VLSKVDDSDVTRCKPVAVTIDLWQNSPLFVLQYVWIFFACTGLNQFERRPGLFIPDSAMAMSMAA